MHKAKGHQIRTYQAVCAIIDEAEMDVNYVNYFFNHEAQETIDGQVHGSLNDVLFHERAVLENRLFPFRIISSTGFWTLTMSR